MKYQHSANSENIQKKSISHLRNSGITGNKICAIDWSDTSLGNMEGWPAALYVSLGIILHSRSPMFILWGEDRLVFYNDALAAYLTNNLLGKKCAEVWPEMVQLADEVWVNNQAFWNKNQQCTSFSGNNVQSSFWTLGLSPIMDELGNTLGVFITCEETTDTVVTLNNLKDREDQLNFTIDAAELGTWDLCPSTNSFTGNARLKEWFGFTESEEINLDTAINLIVEEDRQRVKDAISFALTKESGGRYEIEYSIQNPGSLVTRRLLAKGRVLFSGDTATRFSGTLQDITQRALAQRRIEESEHDYRTLIEEASIATGLYIGRELRIRYANDIMLGYWRKDRAVIGKTLFEALPELHGQPFFDILEHVFTTGEPYSGVEVKAYLEQNGELLPFYFDFTYKPLRNARGEIYAIHHTSVDATTRVHNKQALEQSEQKVRSLVESAPFPIGVYTGREMKIELANPSILAAWERTEDVIGKNYADVLPELASQEVYQQLDDVYTTGVPYHAKNRKIELVINGKLKPFYFNYSFTPLFDSAKRVYGVMNTAADVTDLNIAKQKVEESERNFKNLIMQAPVGICIVKGEEARVEIVNEHFLSLTGKTREQVEGHLLWDAFVELKNDYQNILLNVTRTGISHQSHDEKVLLWRNGKLETLYVNFVYEPLLEDNTALRVIILAIDVTEQVLSRQKIEEAEEKSRLAITSAKLGLYEVIYSSNEMITDRRFNEIWGFNEPATRREYASAIHPDDLPVRNEAHRASLITGSLEYQTRIVWKDGSIHHIRISGRITFNKNNEPEKLVGVVQDVTKEVLAQKTIEENNQNLRNMVVDAPVAIAILKGPDFIVEIANKRMYELWGKDEEAVKGKPVFEAIPEGKEQGFEQLLYNVFSTGQVFIADELPVKLPRQHGLETLYLNFVYQAMRETDGTISGVMAVAIDVTSHVLARRKIQLAEERARLAIESAELGVYEVNLLTRELKYDNRFEEIFNLEKEATWDDLIATIHEEDINVRKEAHALAMKTGVLDYEARILVGDDIKWIRVKGKVVFEGKKPTELLGIVQDITGQKRFEEALEKSVNERTKELAEANFLLQQTNVELNQFAYIASHDLQEPLRKVRTFVQMMQVSLPSLNEKTLNYIQKINTSVERMQTLINDVLKFSLLSKEREKFENVHLHEVLHNVLSDYELLIEQKQATVHCDNLPEIEAIPLQMRQLFTNLISNALKFNNPHRQLHIRISYETLTAKKVATFSELKGSDLYYRIAIKDNGIGFSQEYAQQIFTIFQRLHGKTEYEGTGIGLAMCKKIITNHNGIIYAVSEPDEGSTFVIILPKSQH